MPATPTIIGAGESGDTGVAGMPSFGLGTDQQGRLLLVDVAFPSDANVAGVFSTTWILYYVDLQAPSPITLTAGMGAGDLSLSANTGTPRRVACDGGFTRLGDVDGWADSGPGYVHNIVIGANKYGYARQEQGDTAATIAAALRKIIINSAQDLNATAMAAGATVTSNPVQNTVRLWLARRVTPTRRRTLTESLPSYVLIDSELIQVNATDGSSIVRGAFGCPATTHLSGATIYPIQTMTLYFALDGTLIDTNSWPQVVGTVPFSQKALEAVQMWATNDFGNSPVSTLATCRLGNLFRLSWHRRARSPARTRPAPTTLSISDSVVGFDSTAISRSHCRRHPCCAGSGSRRHPAIRHHHVGPLNRGDDRRRQFGGIDHGGQLRDSGSVEEWRIPYCRDWWQRYRGRRGERWILQNPLTYNAACGDGVTDATSAVATAAGYGGLHLPQSGSISSHE